MPEQVEKRQQGGGLRLGHGVAAVAVGVVGVLIAFWVLSAIAGLVWGIVKVAVIVALVVGVLYLLMGRRRS